MNNVMYFPKHCVKATTLLSGGVCHVTDSKSTWPTARYCPTPPPIEYRRDPMEGTTFKAEKEKVLQQKQKRIP
jgi:hypothetical protein